MSGLGNGKGAGLRPVPSTAKATAQVQPIQKARVTERHTINSEEHTVRIDVSVHAHDDFACCKRVDGRFSISGPTGVYKKLGSIFGDIVDKKYGADRTQGVQTQQADEMQPKGRKKQVTENEVPAWASSLLQIPTDYEEQGHDIRTHSHPKDPLTDLQKTLLAAFQSDGSVKPKLKAYGAELNASLMLFIGEFELVEGYGKTGLAAICLEGFLKAVAQLGYHGTALLSPAPLLGRMEEKTRLREAQQLPPYKWHEIVQILIGRYEELRFKKWLAGRGNLKFSITLMGRLFGEWPSEKAKDAQPQASKTTTESAPIMPTTEVTSATDTTAKVAIYRSAKSIKDSTADRKTFQSLQGGLNAGAESSRKDSQRKTPQQTRVKASSAQTSPAGTPNNKRLSESTKRPGFTSSWALIATSPQYQTSNVVQARARVKTPIAPRVRVAQAYRKTDQVFAPYKQEQAVYEEDSDDDSIQDSEDTSEGDSDHNSSNEGSVTAPDQGHIEDIEESDEGSDAEEMDVAEPQRLQDHVTSQGRLPVNNTRSPRSSVLTTVPEQDDDVEMEDVEADEESQTNEMEIDEAVNETDDASNADEDAGQDENDSEEGDSEEDLDDDDPLKWWPGEILDEDNTEYWCRWYPNPRTGETYDDSWIKKEKANESMVAAWIAQGRF